MAQAGQAGHVLARAVMRHAGPGSEQAFGELHLSLLCSVSESQQHM